MWKNRDNQQGQQCLEMRTCVIMRTRCVTFRSGLDCGFTQAFGLAVDPHATPAKLKQIRQVQ